MNQQVKILVADRDTSRSREKSDLLREAGWIVSAADTTDAMLEAVSHGDVSLLLLDSSMPATENADLCRKVKDEHPETMVLHTFPRETKSLNRYADGLLCEPIEPAMLMAASKSLLRLGAAEQALTTSDARLELAQDAAGIAVVDWDLHSNTAAWSPKLNRLLGTDTRAVSGVPPLQDIIDHLHPDDRERVASAYTRLREHGGSFDDEFRILRADGSVRWIATRGEFTVKRGRDADRMLGIVFDVTARKDAESNNALLAAVVTSSGDAIISMDVDSRVISLNAAAEKLFGYMSSDAVGHDVFKIIPDGRKKEREDFVERLRNGQSVEAQTVRVHKNGTSIHVWLRASPIWSPSGQLVGFSGIYRDMTEARHREHHIRSLLRELTHRSKNLMAVILSMARHSLTSTPSPEDFVAKFIERLRSLSASHDLLSADDWRGASLPDLIRLQIQHEPDWAGRIVTNGPGVVLLPAAAQTIGMALHELLANAQRYGALSNKGGKVEITWGFREKDGPTDVFRLEWRETGGPQVAPPIQVGFGHTVVGRVTGQALGGSSALEFAQGGVLWTLEAPSGAIVRAADDYEANFADAGRPIVG